MSFKMDTEKFNDTIDKYIEDNWSACVDDIASLVQVPSFEDMETADPAAGKPFGEGPAAALDEALKIADRMGFETTNAEGYVGFADMPGESDTQIGIIGHVDVVPAGSGWNFAPYTVDIKEDYLIGRGTLDDKGPVMAALYAMKYWLDQGVKLPYTVRFIFGCNEEIGMGDVTYYREHYEDPAFIFTPDAEFPVGYGEKGGFDATVTSAPIKDGIILEFEGGSATNAVPGQAHCILKMDSPEDPKLCRLESTDRVKVTFEDPHHVRLDATGKSAHASTPDEGINAIGLIVDYLLDNNVLSGDELAFMEFEKKLLDHTDGSGIGIKTADEYFGPLTVIGGTVKLEDDQIVQTLDSRWPTSITPDEIMEALHKLLDPIGATVENTLLMEPFLVKPDEPEIVALSDAFNEVTGLDKKPFTIGGGTYAREFTKGASFGAEMPWVEEPEWLGSMHGPDEGIRQEQLKTAMKIYALAIGKLCELDLK